MSTQKEHYDKKVYSKIGRARKEAILNFINNNSLILDLGCGDGALGELIKKEKAARVYGLDVSTDSVEIAKDRLDKVFRFDIENDDISSIPEIKDLKFDCLVISEVLEHLFYPEKLLESLKGIMRDDAEVVITVPNVLFWKNRLKILFGHFDYQDRGLMDRGHIHFFSYRSLNKLIEQSGFKILGENNHIPTRFTKVLGKLFPGFFSYQFILKIKKK